VTQRFFGPWLIRAKTEPSHFFERFVIASSDAADGVYELADQAPPLDLSVTGSEWTIGFEARLESTDWFPYDPVRSTRFDPDHGLVVTLSTEMVIKPEDGFDVFAHLMTVRLRSTDPVLSPSHTPNPFNFSLPK
jgi:hypothetical protein